MLTYGSKGPETFHGQLSKVTSNVTELKSAHSPSIYDGAEPCNDV